MRVKEESVIIKRDRVYSSYYARATRICPSMMLVGISRGIPDNFNGAIINELRPSESLVYKYKSGLIDEEEYEKIYRAENLNRVNPEEVYNKTRGKVMLCYCGKGKFCHRNIVMKWLAESLGEGIIGGEI